MDVTLQFCLAVTTCYVTQYLAHKPSRLLHRLEEIHAEICASAWLLQSEHLCTACKPDPIGLGRQRTLHGLWICLIKFQISAWMQRWLLRLYLESLALKRDSFNWNSDACYLSKQIHNMSRLKDVDVRLMWQGPVDRSCLNRASVHLQSVVMLLSFYYIHRTSRSIPGTSDGPCFRDPGFSSWSWENASWI